MAGVLHLTLHESHYIFGSLRQAVCQVVLMLTHEGMCCFALWFSAVVYCQCMAVQDVPYVWHNKTAVRVLMMPADWLDAQQPWVPFRKNIRVAAMQCYPGYH